MPFHHLAVAVHDMKAIDRFYTKAMGFELVKVQVAKTPEAGWAKHFFYSTGAGELMAFWELHDPALGSDFPTGMSEAAGLPKWVNHVAFAAEDLGEIERNKNRWLDHGYDVLEIDHRWCYSIYTTDPNGTLVEFCLTTAPFTDEDRVVAREALGRDDLAFAPEPQIKFHRTKSLPVHRAP